MSLSDLTATDYFIAHVARCDGDEEVEVQNAVVKLERLGTGESVEAAPSEIAELIKLKRVFWRLR